MVADILIVDDEDDIRELVAGILEDEGHGARLARNSDEAIAAIEARRPQLILLDIWLQGSKLDGLQLLEAVKRQHPVRAGGDDFGPRQHRDGGDGDQARRLRLHRKAVQGRSSDPDRRAGVGDFAPETGGQRSEGARRLRRPNGRLFVGGSQSQADHRQARTGEFAHPHFRRRRLRQGAGRPAHSRKFGARRRPLRRHQRPGDVAREDGSGIVRGRGGRRRARRGSAPSRRRTAARSISTKSPTCRARRRRKSCGCWSTRTFSASAAPRGSMSTSGSSRRPAGIWPRRSPRAAFARICFTGFRWCRFAFRRWPSGERTFPNSFNIF